MEETWWRGCKVLVNQTTGCSRHKWMNPHTDHEIEVDECVCKTDLCNEEMGPIPDTTTARTSTTTKECKSRYLAKIQIAMRVFKSSIIFSDWSTMLLLR